jgi:hypothetical protein
LAALPNVTAMVNKAEIQYLLASQICAILEWEHSINLKKFYLENDFDENVLFSVFLDCVKNTAMLMTVAGGIGLISVVEACFSRYIYMLMGIFFCSLPLLFPSRNLFEGRIYYRI